MHWVIDRSTKYICVRGDAVNKYAHQPDPIRDTTAVNNNLQRELKSPGCSRPDGERPDGMSSIPWTRGRRSVHWDFTFCDTFAQSYLKQTWRHLGDAAKQAEGRKVCHNTVTYTTISFSYLPPPKCLLWLETYSVGRGEGFEKTRQVIEFYQKSQSEWISHMQFIRLIHAPLFRNFSHSQWINSKTDTWVQWSEYPFCSIVSVSSQFLCCNPESRFVFTILWSFQWMQRCATAYTNGYM